MKPKSFQIIKEDGRSEDFSIEKFRNSLLKSHATLEQIQQVENQLESEWYPGIRTRDIYKMASRLLRRQSPAKSARFGLKKAIMTLGPSGYPFEKFIGALFSAKGYDVQVGQVLNGKCVTHEVDVVAKKDDELVLVECKYHNQSGINVDVKVPLYIHSRFQDLLENDVVQLPQSRFTGWIATNSRFSDDAESFGRCKGIQLLSWNYPNGNALRDWIDRLRLYPITCLQSLNGSEKNYLLEAGIVLVKDLAAHPTWLEKAGIQKTRLEHAMAEIQDLISG